MTSAYLAPSIFEIYNARHLSPERIARTFVPPDQTFDKLATTNNHIVVGPRGSGKTTLLKMLTLPALLSWKSPERQEILPQVDFIGILIAADRSWRSQIGAVPADEHQAVNVGGIAFTTHVLNSVARTLDQLALFRDGNKAAVSFSPEPLSKEQEAALSQMIAEQWQLKLPLRNLLGLQLALRARLADLKSVAQFARRAADPEGFLLANVPYAPLDYRENLKFALEAYEAVSGNRGLTYALLFDEFELAPDAIQHDVLSYLRGEEAGNLVHKLALAPYNQNFMSAIASSDSSKKNDYEVIDLWYPRKNAARAFSEKLFRMNVDDRGLGAETPEAVLGQSEFDFSDADEAMPYAEDGLVAEAMGELATIDRSFQEYLLKHRIDLSVWSQLSEARRARVRKFRSVVVIRNYFRSRTLDPPSGRVIERASRKVHTIYTGAPTLFAICEGNPRILIGLLSPILRQLEIERQRSRKKSVDKNFQASQVKEAVSAFRALLKTTVQGDVAGADGRGLLRMLDEIGEYFHVECVKGPFKPQPHLTFVVPSNAENSTLALIGRALNMGAIIFIPDHDADPILTSLRGKRFRLSFLLAAYYKLPIMIGAEISLRSVMERYKTVSDDEKLQLGQMELFEEYGEDGA